MKYEIMAIIANDLSEKDASKQAQDSVIKRIKELKGTTSFEDFWGARGFAYQIKKQTWGYYFLAQFEFDGTNLMELRRELNLDTKVVRFLISKVHKNAPAPRKYAEMQKEWEAFDKEKKVTEAEAKAPTSKPARPAVAKVAPAAPKIVEPKEEPKKVANKDEVDKKLDEILEDSSLDL
jgi:small subunit ribosomal protein S6